MVQVQIAVTAQVTLQVLVHMKVTVTVQVTVQVTAQVQVTVTVQVQGLLVNPNTGAVWTV